MTASSWIQPSDSLGTSTVQQKKYCLTSTARSKEATQLPPVLLGFSLWEKQSKKFGYPETTVLERPHVSMPVKCPADLLVYCQHQLPAMKDILDSQLSPAFRWLQPLLAFDLLQLHERLQARATQPSLPDPQNHEQNKIVNWFYFLKLLIWE